LPALGRLMNQSKNYYAVLGVLPSAEPIVIRAAYRAMALKYHPDTWVGDRRTAEGQIRDLNEAYEILSNEEKRRLYDTLHHGRNRTQAGFGDQKDAAAGIKPGSSALWAFARNVGIIFKWLAVGSLSVVALWAIFVWSMSAYNRYAEAEAAAAAARTLAQISVSFTTSKDWCRDDKFPLFVSVANNSSKILESFTITLSARKVGQSSDITNYHPYTDDHIMDSKHSRAFCWAPDLREQISDPRALQWSVASKSFTFRD
jgi:curved DNA-binding protein CbpA